MRVATARTAVEFARRYDWKIERIFPTVPGILAQEFLDLAVPLSEAERVEPLYHQQCIVQELAQLSFEHLLRLLHHPAVTTDQAHLIARGLLAFAYHCSRPEHWRIMPADGFSEDEVRYVYELAARNKLPRQRDAIQAIVDEEKVWERRTNLFSFFYGLPDTRDELRTLLVLSS